MKSHKYLLCIFLLVSCVNSKKENKLTSYDITRGIEIDEKVFLSSVADSIRYVPLEITNESLISGISEITFTDKYILVSDNLDKLLLFGNDGKFLRQIGTKGPGPFEYIHTSKAVFSANGEEIVLFDGAGLKLLKYNTSTGEGLTEVRITRFIPRSFDYLNDTTLAFYCSAASFMSSGSFFHIFLMNNNLEIIDSLYHRPDLETVDLNLRGWGLTGLYGQKGNLYFWDSDTDTIYSLNRNRMIEPGFEFKYDKYKIPLSIRHTQGFESTSGNYFFYDCIIETDNYFFIDGILQGRYMKSILYDKQTGKSRNVVFNYDFHDRGFHNDLDGGMPFWPRGKINDQAVYDIISPYNLKRLMSNDYFKTIPVKDEKNHSEFLSLLGKSDLADNPIIVIVRLK